MIHATACWFADDEYHRYSASGNTEEELQTNILAVLITKSVPKKHWVEREEDQCTSTG